jgi:acyl carrier protein
MTDDYLRNMIRKTLVETISDIQREAKRKVPPLTDDTVPFDDVPGFDSVSGVEAAVLFSERMEVEIDEIKFVSSNTGKRMPVRDIVELILQKDGAAIANKLGTSDNRAASA